MDVVFCHRYDHLTPMEEVCRAFDSVIKSGKVHYWGTSEWSTGSIFEAYMICERFNLIKPIVEKNNLTKSSKKIFRKDLEDFLMFINRIFFHIMHLIYFVALI